MGHKRNDCPKAAWNQNRAPPPEQPRLQISAPRRTPLAPSARQQARDFRKPQAGGRVYYLEAEEEGNRDPHAVAGTFIVNTLPTKVLFDADATHSFVNPTTATRMACAFDELDI